MKRTGYIYITITLKAIWFTNIVKYFIIFHWSKCVSDYISLSHYPNMEGWTMKKMFCSKVRKEKHLSSNFFFI